jgi:membrane protease YdiL (CAAX protease family)
MPVFLIGTKQVIRIMNPLSFSVVCVLIAAGCIPIQLLELGEEIGWREYLLPKQVAVYGMRKGVLLNGFYWGIAHLPLIFLGFNYSLENIGAPWSNMLMMIIVCMTLFLVYTENFVVKENHNKLMPVGFRRS